VLGLSVLAKSILLHYFPAYPLATAGVPPVENRWPRHRRYQERDKGWNKETKEMERTCAVIFTSIFTLFQFRII